MADEAAYGREAEQIFLQICEEALEHRSPERFNGSLSASELHELDRPVPALSPRWQRLQDEPIEIQIAVVLTAHGLPKVRPWPSWTARQNEDTARQLVTLSLQRELPLTQAQLMPILQSWRDEPMSFCHDEPGLARIAAVERLVAGTALPEELRAVLEAISARTREDYWGGPRKYNAELLDRIDWLLNPPAAGETALPSGAFAKALRDWAEALPKAEGEAWKDLAVHCAKARDKSKPTKAWLKVVPQLVAKVGQPQLSARLAHWMDEIVPNPMKPDYSLDVMKGLLWAAGTFNDGAVVGKIGRFCEECFRSLVHGQDDPNTNEISIGLGNAAIWGLSAMPDEPRAVMELFRLRDAIKKRAVHNIIDARLAALAKQRGLTVDQLEDCSLPASELEEGSARRMQIRRLEQSWVEDRSWTFADWEKQLLGHPLRGPIVSALIWQVGEATVMPEAGELCDVEGRSIPIGADDQVRLWHPLDKEPREVSAWQARILQRGLLQPIKQVDREVFALTDAERTTKTYSNRFAAHILNQQKFKVLCEDRGWNHALLEFEEGDYLEPELKSPRRILPAFGVTVFYEVALVLNDYQQLDGSPLHITSDHVYFTDKRQRVLALDQVAPIVFSEMLRDVRLFVAGAGVGNDPTWSDRRNRPGNSG